MTIQIKNNRPLCPVCGLHARFVVLTVKCTLNDDGTAGTIEHLGSIIGQVEYECVNGHAFIEEKLINEGKYNEC